MNKISYILNILLIVLCICMSIIIINLLNKIDDRYARINEYSEYCETLNIRTNKLRKEIVKLEKDILGLKINNCILESMVNTNNDEDDKNE